MPIKSRLLVLSEDLEAANLLTQILELNQFEVQSSLGMADLVSKIQDFNPDIAVMDARFPLEAVSVFSSKTDGKTALIPVLYLAEAGRDIKRIGAWHRDIDDFIIKPFAYKELIARLHLMSRRSICLQTIIRSGSLMMDVEKRIMQIGHEEVRLTLKEFELFKYLYANRHRLLNKDEIFNQIWGHQSDSFRSTVYTHINRLRKKLKDHGSKIKSVPGVGFRFDERGN